MSRKWLTLLWTSLATLAWFLAPVPGWANNARPVEELVLAADAAMREKRPSEAIDLLRKANKRDPGRQGIARRLAEAHEKLDHHGSAARWFQKAADIAVKRGDSDASKLKRRADKARAKALVLHVVSEQCLAETKFTIWEGGKLGERARDPEAPDAISEVSCNWITPLDVGNEYLLEGTAPGHLVVTRRIQATNVGERSEFMKFRRFMSEPKDPDDSTPKLTKRPDPIMPPNSAATIPDTRGNYRVTGYVLLVAGAASLGTGMVLALNNPQKGELVAERVLFGAGTPLALAGLLFVMFNLEPVPSTKAGARLAPVVTPRGIGLVGTF